MPSDHSEGPRTEIVKAIGVVTDTPERRPGIRPRVDSQLVQLVNDNDGGFVAVAIADDGSLHIVLHSGSVTVDDRRRRDDRVITG
jgi:hypothetical protein